MKNLNAEEQGVIQAAVHQADVLEQQQSAVNLGSVDANGHSVLVE